MGRRKTKTNTYERLLEKKKEEGSPKGGNAKKGKRKRPGVTESARRKGERDRQSYQWHIQSDKIVSFGGKELHLGIDQGRGGRGERRRKKGGGGAKQHHRGVQFVR